MKQIVAAKLGNKSRSYVNAVAKGKVFNEEINHLLQANDYDFLYSLIGNPTMREICDVAVMRCKTKEARIHAGKLRLAFERLQRPK